MITYSINVSINGQHYAWVGLPPLREDEAIERFRTIRTRMGLSFLCELTSHSPSISTKIEID